MTASYPAVPVAFNDSKTHRRILAEASNRHNNAKFNCSLPATLAVSATSTVINDARITANSVFAFTPLSAHAASSLSTLYVSSQKTGTATLNHASTADTDKNFNIGIFG